MEWGKRDGGLSQLTYDAAKAHTDLVHVMSLFGEQDTDGGGRQ